jgi:hypothetical protein
MIEVEQPAIGTSFVRDLFEQLGGRAETRESNNSAH